MHPSERANSLSEEKLCSDITEEVITSDIIEDLTEDLSNSEAGTCEKCKELAEQSQRSSDKIHTGKY